ncbi:hypothetical protein MO973_00765 [Paenibacillus sp. TRM 82003]|nr:hypothetical protein [Paenibacillus sp. TRM 82003]
MEFKKLMLGSVEIAIQNDNTRNEDVYILSGDAFRGLQLDKPKVERIIFDHLEEPERFIVSQEQDGPTVYTKQHEAAIELAMYVNDKRGAKVSDKELQDVHDKLIELQKGTVPN